MKISKLISSFFYIGFIPPSSGTLASLVTILIWYYLISLPLSLFILLVIALCVIGVYSTKYSLKYFTSVDPKEVVIDEVCGMLISLIGVSVNYKNAIIAFLLFRFFDILKPLYIRRLESLPGAYGIMADDILAGIYSMIILNIINYLGGISWH